MKKLVLVCGILAGVVNIGMGAMSEEELRRVVYNCFEYGDKSSCQALVNNGTPSVEQCSESCRTIGKVYYNAGRYREAIPYFEKTIASGNNDGYSPLGAVYYSLQDFYNARKYFEMGCDNNYGDSCAILGTLYHAGKGVRQDYAKAAELYKKACDMKVGTACNNLGVLYLEGQGVRQNLSTAKQYYGKACDLGDQMGCDNYKSFN